MKKLKLVEAPVEEIEEIEIEEEVPVEDVVEENPVEEIATGEDNELITDETDKEIIDFIDSVELEEIRDLLLDIPDDIQILLLNDEVVVFTEEKPEGQLILTIVEEDDSAELISKPMPFKLEEIMLDDTIIKYLPEETYKGHQNFIDLLMQKLETDEDIAEEVTEEISEEDLKDVLPEIEDKDTEEEDEKN